MKQTLALAIAALALAAAGCGGDDEESSAPADTNTGTSSTEAPAASSGGGATTKLDIAADPSGALKFDPSSLDAKPGKVSIVMDNPSELPHAVGIEGNGVDVEGQVVNKGGKSTAEADLKAGTYEFYCPVPGHKEGGMVGELTVK
jgi:uncharacterized cupredoxin-like copper-binding protein